MEDKLLFSDDLIKEIDVLKTDINRSLIYTIHVVSSKSIGHDNKEQFCSEIAKLGNELKTSILKFDLEKMDSYNLREHEKCFIESAKELHKSISKLLETADKKYCIIIDKNAFFDINEIIIKLRDKSMYSEYLLSKDKVDNLLSLKTLIIKIYEYQTKNAINKEKEMDKQFYQLKENTFIQCLRNKENRNAEYLFRSIQLIKKMVSSEGKKIEIDKPEDGLSSNILMSMDSNKLLLTYDWSGLKLNILMEKTNNKYQLSYRIDGTISKGGAAVEYLINETVLFENEKIFERISGIDFLYEQYEKAVIHKQSEENNKHNENEMKNKKILDKAIDDMLFS